MENWYIIRALCMCAVASKSIAAIQQVTRLKNALQAQGKKQEADALEELLNPKDTGDEIGIVYRSGRDIRPAEEESRPTTIKLINNRASSLNIDLLSMPYYSAPQIETIESGIFDWVELMLGMNAYRYQIGLMKVTSKYLAQIVEPFNYVGFDDDPSLRKQTLSKAFTLENDIYSMTIPCDFWIGNKERLTYNLRNEVQISLYPAQRQQFRDRINRAEPFYKQYKRPSGIPKQSSTIPPQV